MTKFKTATSSALAAITLLGCGDATIEAGALVIRDIQNTSGATIGTVTLSHLQTGGTALIVDVSGLEPGEHAVHFHENPVCDGSTDFTSSGGHYNPTGMTHGSASTNPKHVGDLDNLTVAANGDGTLNTTTMAATLTGIGGTVELLDNTSLIIHAKADDNISQPSGAAGGRIACAIINR